MKMLTSDLISLSIHEELNLQGVELAIHPDLFVEPFGGVQGNGARHSHLGLNRTLPSSGSASMASATTQTMSGSILPLSKSIISNFSSPVIQEHKVSGFSASHALPSLTVGNREMQPHGSSLAESKPPRIRKLEIGNLIEIKVWDPKPSNQVGLSSRSEPQSQTSNFPMDSSMTSEWLKESPSLTSLKKNFLDTSIVTSKDCPKSPLTPKINLANRTPDSFLSPQSSRNSLSKGAETNTEADTSSTDSTAESNLKDMIQNLSLPKSPKQDSPFLSERHVTANPRNRTALLDHSIRTGKPPLQQKRNSIQSEPRTQSAMTKLPKPLHIREISDVTMDTSLAVPPAPSHDIQLGNLSADSQEESSNELDTISRIEMSHTLRTSIIMIVTDQTLTSLNGQSRTQISILRQIADLYQLSPYDMVTVSRIDPEAEQTVFEAVSVDFVCFTIKDQFISRGNMHTFQKSLIKRWIYEGERVFNLTTGIKAYAREIRQAGSQTKSGIITEDTKITFRSRSSRIIWLVQISSEMWDYSNPYGSDADKKEESACELVFDKFVRFMYKLFKKWKELEVTHSLTVVFFSRTIVFNKNIKSQESQHLFSKDVYGRYFEDHYKTVVDNETLSDWDSLIVRIKREFVTYPLDLRWDLSKDNYRRPSTAMQGNLLEAINVTLNLLQFHFLDRDLHRTGNSIVVVSPECGVFEVDKSLAGITYQRMMDNGIGSDMVCLGLPPLHVAPFFLYNNFLRKDENSKQESEPHSEVPHWMHLSFVRYDGDTTSHAPVDIKSQTLTDGKSIIESLNVASNGFLLPYAKPSDSVLLADKVFPAVLNVSAMPPISSSQSQQRQLIAGRDFKDILEACRPRTSSYMLPSPLVNLLLVLQKQSSETADASLNLNARQSATLPNPGRLHLKEWGTIDFDDMDGPIYLQGIGSRAASIRTRSPDLIAENGEVQSSPSSSFASQLYGTSLEGTAFSFAMGAGRFPPPIQGKLGIQLQRSSSIELNALFTEEDSNIDEAIFRSAMNVHDKSFASHAVKGIRPNLDLTGFVSSIMDNEVNNDPSDENHSTSSWSATDTTGGLMAALSKYEVEESKFGEVGTFKDANPFVSVGSPNQSVAFTESSLRPLTFMSMAGAKIGSEPPSLFPNLTAHQSMHLFMKSHHQLISGSFDQRKCEMTRSISMFPQIPGMTQSDLHLPKSSNSVGGTSPNTISIMPVPPMAPTIMNVPTSNFQTNSGRGSKGMKSVVNPFRQQDEDDELEKKSHNRRRWSHVFPIGELEFKRHTGPLWKSLCQPAILPLTIDYYPTPQELMNEKIYKFNHYQLTLQGMENTGYSSHRKLLMEMVRQRITQDFQVVPPSVLSASNAVSEGDTQHTLSMGHRIHVLSYDSQSDTINVKITTATPKDDDTPIKYKYLMYTPFTTSYHQVVQTFQKISQPYRWNKMDAVILEDDDAKLTIDLRFRRLQFVLIPSKHSSVDAEQEYIEKFWRLLDYLGKLRDKEEASSNLVVRTLTMKDERPGLFKSLQGVRKGITDDMIRFKIRLRKGKSETYEWVEVSIDSVFDTCRTYRIMFNWLVASTSKVEGQVQLVQRRCAQFGLELISTPQICISNDIFLNPFAIPEIFYVRKSGKLDSVRCWLEAEDFIDDGVHMTDPSFLNGIGKPDEFRFHLKRVKNVACRQLIHRPTSAIFARLLVDEKDWIVIAFILNRRRIRERNLMSTTVMLIEKFQAHVNSLN